MPKIAPICGVVQRCAVALAVRAGSWRPSLPPKRRPRLRLRRRRPPKGYECHDNELTGSGPGFKSSQEEFEEAAMADWLDKAQAVYRRRGLEDDQGSGDGMRQAGALQQMLRHRRAVSSEAEELG